MSAPITIRLPGPPRGKGRHRSRVINMPGQGARVRTHSDPKTVAYEGALRLAAGAVMAGRVPVCGMLKVAIFAMMPIPSSWSKRKKQEARDRIVRPTTKPDFDNLAKVIDALNGIVWVDDAAVVDGYVRKFYSDTPELVIEVTPLEPQVAA